jgi:tetratricopeptide (TPR) repeat protein
MIGLRMKSECIIPLLFVLFSVKAWSTDLTVPLQALKNKEYEKALMLYKEIEKDGEYSSDIYQNMAVASLSLGKDVEAIIYIEKALKLKPENDELKQLLSSVHKRNSKIESDDSNSAVLSFINKTIGTLSTTTWILLSLLCLLVMGWIVYTGFPDQILVRSNHMKLALSLFLFMIFSGFASYRQYQVHNQNTIIITAEDAILKISPDSASPDLTELVPGSKVYFKDQINDWWLVSTVFGDEGWIRSTQGQRL